MSFVPKLLIFLAVLLIGWIIAKAVSKFLGIILEKSGFTRLLDRAGADDVLANASIDPVGLITKLAYYLILLIALQLALTAFGPSNPVSAVANAVKDILTASLGGVSYGPLLARRTAAARTALRPPVRATPRRRPRAAVGRLQVAPVGQAAASTSSTRSAIESTIRVGR